MRATNEKILGCRIVGQCHSSQTNCRSCTVALATIADKVIRKVIDKLVFEWEVSVLYSQFKVVVGLVQLVPENKYECDDPLSKILGLLHLLKYVPETVGTPSASPSS